MTELVTLENQDAKSLIKRARHQEEVKNAVDDSTKDVAQSTREAYASAIKKWERFAETREFTALPANPAAVATYVSAMLRGYVDEDYVDEARTTKKDVHEPPKSLSQIEKAIAAIKRHHLNAGYDSPTVTATVQRQLKAVRRARAGTKKKQARALSIEEIRMMSRACDTTTPEGRRDRALLLVGVSLGLRSDNLVNLDTDDFEPVSGGYDVTLRRSKTDQEGRGEVVAMGRAPEAVLCPAEAVTALLGDRTNGALFTPARGVKADRLTSDSVTRVVRRLARASGVAETGLSSHSLRSTMITLAYASSASIPESEIARLSGHANIIILRNYDRSSRWVTPTSSLIWQG